jgi:hypothetical protein
LYSAEELGRRYRENHLTALEFAESSLRESSNSTVSIPLALDVPQRIALCERMIDASVPTRVNGRLLETWAET